MQQYKDIRPTTQEALDRVTRAVGALAEGRMILVVDDFERENEADLVLAADFAGPEAVNFMAREGRGLICQTITAGRADALRLAPQERENTALHGTAFTVSVDAARDIATGISAADRAHTMRLVASKAQRPEELARPGHVFPIVAQDGGVFARRGHTEAGCDLARLAGLTASAVICEVMDDDGTMARGERVIAMARAHGMPLVSVEDLVLYRSFTGDASVRAVAETQMPTRFGTFAATVWTTDDPGCREIVSLSTIAEGDALAGVGKAPLLRIHSECLTGEAFGSLRCDCGPQLDAALEAIAQEPGVVLYLKQEGRGIGLVDKLRAYALQDRGLDTVDANLHLGRRPDERNYAAAGAVLRELGLTRVRILTNNPDKYEAVRCAGIDAERLPLEVGRDTANQNYLAAKVRRMGHLMSAGAR